MNCYGYKLSIVQVWCCNNCGLIVKIHCMYPLPLSFYHGQKSKKLAPEYCLSTSVNGKMFFPTQQVLFMVILGENNTKQL